MTPADFLRVALALVVLPALVMIGRRLRGEPWARSAAAALVAVYAVLAFGVLEHYFAPDALNVLQHAGYAVAGAFALASALAMRAQSREALRR